MEELRHLEDLPSPHNKFWVPCMWFVNLALRARTEGRINNDVALTAILTVGFICFCLQDRRAGTWLLNVFQLLELVLHRPGVEQSPGEVHEAVRL